MLSSEQVGSSHRNLFNNKMVQKKSLDDFPSIDSMFSSTLGDDKLSQNKATTPNKMAKRDDGVSNLSWLVNYSAASIFDPASADEREEHARHNKIKPIHTRPALTYTELIEKALKDKGQLTVAGIYQWINTNFPYYQKGDSRWKNSVRHNLSINPQFRKGKKSKDGGSGHFWTLNSEDENVKPCNDLEMDYDKEVEAATKSILELSPREPLHLSAIDENDYALCRTEAGHSIVVDDSHADTTITVNDDTDLRRIAREILMGTQPDHASVEFIEPHKQYEEPPEETHEETESISIPESLFCDSALFAGAFELGFTQEELLGTDLLDDSEDIKIS